MVCHMTDPPIRIISRTLVLLARKKISRKEFRVLWLLRRASASSRTCNVTSRMRLRRARPDLWEPWGSNPPGRPGPISISLGLTKPVRLIKGSLGQLERRDLAVDRVNIPNDWIFGEEQGELRFRRILPVKRHAGAEMDRPETGENERNELRTPRSVSAKRSVVFSTREVVGIDFPGAVIADQDVGGVWAETSDIGRVSIDITAAPHGDWKRPDAPLLPPPNRFIKCPSYENLSTAPPTPLGPR